MNYQLAEWSAKIEVGLPSIDQQHKQLFDLAASFRGNGDHIRVIKSLATLTDYVKVHFREEEAMMAACQYSGLEAHRLLHVEFREMLFKLLENARNMSLDEIADQVSFLINGWFYHHILVVDFAYIPDVKAGLAAEAILAHGG